MKGISRKRLFSLIYYLINGWLLLEVLFLLSGAFQAAHRYSGRALSGFGEDKYHYWLGVARELLYPALLIVVLSLLLGIIRSFRRNKVFDTVVIHQITCIGYAYLAYALLIAVITSLGQLSQMQVDVSMFFLDILLVNIWNLARGAFLV